MKNVIKSKYEIFKQKTYIIIYGTCTFWGRMFDIILLIFILISVLLVMLESVKGIDRRLHQPLIILEWTITIFFTIEYILRVISNKKPKEYIFSFYGLVDLLSILPIYLSFFFAGSKFFVIMRVLRLLRVFRILALAKFSEQATELREAVYASRTKILVFIYFVLVLCVILGTFMYMIEPHEATFSSIPKSIYWCIVTLTTVGYGDIVPITVAGQIIASIIMILGYGIIAVPTGIITSEYSRLKNKKEHQYEPHLIKTCPKCGNLSHHSEATFCHQCGEKLTEQTLKKKEYCGHYEI